MKWLKDYFDLSRKEEAGFIALFAIIIILFGLQFFIPYFIPETKTDFSNLQKVAEQLESGKRDTGIPLTKKEHTYPGPKKTLTVPVDINTADSVKLMTIKGIGPTFAGRILDFRRKLGCFISVDQLMDVHGIRAEKYGYLKPQVCLSAGHPKYLNINKAKESAIKDCPYFDEESADKILKYRKEHGRFKSIESLKKLLNMDDQTFEKVKGYISL